MPPILAFTICTAFVLWLLHLESKQKSPDVSFAFWIPTIWMLVNCSKPLGIWLGIGGADMEAGSPLDRAFLLCLAFFSIIISVKRHIIWTEIVKSNIWIVVLVLYMLISILWSDIPFVSFKRWTRDLIAIIICFSISTERNPYEAFQCLFRRLIYILIPFSLLLIKYYPQLGVNYSTTGKRMWMGVGLHKNSMSELCILFILFFMWTFIRRWRGRDKAVVWYQIHVELFLLGLTIYIFMGPQHTLTNSATSLISLIVAIMVLIYLGWLKQRGTLLNKYALAIIIAFIIVYATVTPFLGGLKGIDISSAVGRNEDLTGRSEIWARLIPYVSAKPILGHGFGGFWTDAMRANIMAAHPHNGYLDIILNIGFVGLFLFSMFLIKNCLNAGEEMTKDFDWGILWLCFLMITVLHNISETSAISFRSTNISVLLLLSSVTIPVLSVKKRP